MKQNKMIDFDSYQNTKVELDVYKKRLSLIKEYEKKYLEEKKQLKKLIILGQNLLCQMEDDIVSLEGIENKLYKEIVIEGLNVSSAIEKVAFDEEKDTSTLWKNYYPSVKRKIEKLNLMMKNDDDN